MKKNEFIGRERELSILKKASESSEAEMVAVIGRRRVGKTFLVKTAFAGRIDFEITGVQNAPLDEQLENFAYHINHTFYKGYSPAECIDNICFSKSGILTDEFLKLYPALFDNAEKHLAVIRALSKKWKGLTRKELLETGGLPDGGGTTLVLQELESSGFISQYFPFRKNRKDVLYRLTDEYSLFYLHFIEHQKRQGAGVWKELSQTQLYKSWSGFAFENICFKHLAQIKKALGISGVYTEASSFAFKGNDVEKGIQIDLLFDRKDQIINLFEIKFYNEIWILNKTEALDLREKVAIFRRVSKTKKHIFLTLISTFGVRQNEHSIGLVDRHFDLDILFEPN